jgi:hypothetical protein
VVALAELDDKIKEIEELVNKDYQLLTKDLSSISQKFTQLHQEYLEVSRGAVSDLMEGLAELRQKDFLSGGIKLIKAAIKGGVAWWKKKKWFNQFTSALEQIYNTRLEIIEQKLRDIELVEREHLPFIRDTAEKLLQQLVSFNPSSPQVREGVVDRAESVVITLLKSYYIAGVGKFLKAAYEDARNARVIAGDISIIKEELSRGITEVRELLHKLSPSSDSPLIEVLNRNRVFGGSNG